MKEILSEYERGRLNERVAELEKKTDAQIVLAVIRRSDSYAELPWKAFALGASIAGLLVFFIDMAVSYWISHIVMLIAVAATLSAGAFLALLAVFFPRFAKLFLSEYRAETETRQYAESLFLNRELFATSKRTGVLMLVSLFEKQIVIIPDKGLKAKLSEDAVKEIVAKMSDSINWNNSGHALEIGLQKLSEALCASGQAESAEACGNELSNDIIEEKGV